MVARTNFEDAPLVSRAIGSVLVGFARELNFDAGEIGFETAEALTGCSGTSQPHPKAGEIGSDLRP